MQTVLITGAATGIGRASALKMAQDGWTVFAGVRKQADGESLLAAGGERIVPLILDVTDGEQVAAAVAQIGEQVGDRGLDGLVNNAGIGVAGPLELIPIDDLRRQFEVNVFGLMAITQALLPAAAQRAWTTGAASPPSEVVSRAVHRPLLRLQVRRRGAGRRAARRAASLEHQGRADRAWLDRHADLGQGGRRSASGRDSQ